jgi:sugar-phosphatase
MRLTPGTQLRAQALLFDMDGTLVDSTRAVHASWRRFAARHGYTDIEHLLRVQQGRRPVETLGDFAFLGYDVQQEAALMVAQEHADLDGIVEVPGAGALLRSLPRDRWAVTTSADTVLCGLRMRAAGLPEPPVLISADDVSVGKPDPTCYQVAAHRLGVAPQHCIVFEDAPAGIAAGRAAGATVIAVATTRSGEELNGDLWVPDLRGLAARAEADGTLLLALAG